MNVFLDQVLESLNVGALEMITKDNMATMSIRISDADKNFITSGKYECE